MTDVHTNDAVDYDVKVLIENLVNQIDFLNSISNNFRTKNESRHTKTMNKSQRKRSGRKRRIFSSSEDDSSSSTDDSYVSNNNTLVNGDSDSDSEEQKALRNRNGPCTRNELAIDDLPPIENLTITLSEETPIERIGHIRHIIDGKLVIIESLLHSSPLNDDSVLFNSHRRSIGLIFETFGPVEKPYYSIRYNDIDSIQQRQIELNQEVFYAPKETTYTKYVFVQELKALKGSDASWEDDNEPPNFALDYSDDEQERIAKAVLKGKRKIDNNNDEQMPNPNNSTSRTGLNNNSSSYIHMGRGRNRGFQHGNNNNRPSPNLPNWFQNTLTSTSSQRGSMTQQQQSHSTFWQQNQTNTIDSIPISSSRTGYFTNPPNSNDNVVQQTYQNNNSTSSVFPWM